jgi:D-3-phosphoglycerate dehydrogenase / 2-oxoglutarate reductase
LLACNRKICWFDRDNKAGRYDLKAHTPLRRLRGHTLGLMGIGKIGRAVAQRAAAFGLRVIALQPRRGTGKTELDGIATFPLDELLEQSDYVSLHLPATSETVGIINRSAFEKMKDGVVLVNTARGSLIRSEDLVNALNSGKVAAAGVDVWPTEPLLQGDPLAAHPRVIATPHAAFYSSESLLELQRTTASQAAEILSGRIPENIVNPTVLESPLLRVRL